MRKRSFGGSGGAWSARRYLVLVAAGPPNTIRGGVPPLEALGAEGGYQMHCPNMALDAVPSLVQVPGRLAAELGIIAQPLGWVVRDSKPSDDVSVCQQLSQAVWLMNCHGCQVAEEGLKPAGKVADFPFGLGSHGQLEAPTLGALYLQGLLCCYSWG